MSTTEDHAGTGWMTSLPEQGATNSRGIRSWSPIAGTVFVVLMLVRTFSVARVPNPAAAPLTIAADLADGGDDMPNLVGAGGRR